MKNLLKKLTISITLFGAALFFNACNSGSSTSSADTTKLMKDTSKMGSSMTNQNQMKQDSQSVADLVTANYDEIKVLELAVTKVMPADLRTNVKKMLSDHKKALQQLQDLASKRNIGIPTDANDAGVNEYNTLNKEAGKDFENDFLSWAIKTHNDAISKCQDISKNSHNNDLVTWCNNILPTLQEHLQMAKNAQDNLNKQS